MSSRYTDSELIEHAKQFATRKDWEAYGDTEVARGLPSHHRVAYKRGSDFYRKCCAHMPDERGGFRGFRYSDAELIASARQHKTRGSWKRNAYNFYQIARTRSVWDECVAHMLPAANPFAHDYVVYAEEFSDNHAYVGLTLVPANRQAAHACRGPVYDHAQKTGLNPVFKILQAQLDFAAVGAAEAAWQANYASAGWIALHRAKAGSLGSIKIKGKWTRELVLAEAQKFKTKQAWIDGSQGTYRLAKREGWFEEAAAHMPKRDGTSQVGRQVSDATRLKQSEAKQGTTHTPEQRAARSAAVKLWWAARRSHPVLP